MTRRLINRLASFLVPSPAHRPGMGLTFLILFLLTLPAGAVLKEKNIDETLLVLRSELQGYSRDQQEALNKTLERESAIQADLDGYLEEANQIALMVYSQKQDYVFDITYACQQATDLYRRFHNNSLPFDTIMAQLDIEIARYTGLHNILRDLEADSLDERQRTECQECIRMAHGILASLGKQKSSLARFQTKYDAVDNRLNELFDYAQRRYSGIQANIFTKRGEDYLTILGQLDTHWSSSTQALTEKYSPHTGAQSQWRGNIVWMIFAIMVIYSLIATLIGNLIYRLIIPRTRLAHSLQAKRRSATMCFATISFAVVLWIVNLTVSHNFVHTASNLLIQYAWLLAAIQLSLIIRLKPEQISSGFHIYAPVLIMGFIVIVLRIVFLPGEVIALFLPPILAVATVMQGWSVRRYNRVLPRSDIFYTWITLAVLVASVIFAWDGRVLMSVQLFIWWIMQLTCVQTITCLYDLLERYEEHRIEEGATIHRTWLVDLINKCLLPVAAIYSFLFSIYWSADVFNMSGWVMEVFVQDYVQVEDVISLSLFRVTLVASLWFVARYVMYFVRANLRLRSDNPGTLVLGINVSQILVWGLWLIVAMHVLRIGNSWVLVITGGLSTGIGFALKDTLENLFYGLSLMLGRLHVGDVIECDGVRGTVSNITYQSTTIQSTDGAEMAFLNSQLFSKNFKNMTRNHNLELVVIPVGVAYGTDVSHVRDVLVRSLSRLTCYDKAKGIDVRFQDFGSSSVDLKVLVWVDVLNKGAAMSAIMETIYDTLNRESIEIPFPQLDIHQR